MDVEIRSESTSAPKPLVSRRARQEPLLQRVDGNYLDVEGRLNHSASELLDRLDLEAVLRLVLELDWTDSGLLQLSLPLGSAENGIWRI